MMQSQEGVFFTLKWCYLLTCSYALLYPQRLFAFLKRFRVDYTMKNLTLSNCLNTTMYWIRNQPWWKENQNFIRKGRWFTYLSYYSFFGAIKNQNFQFLQEMIYRYTSYDCCVYAITYNPKRKTEVMHWKVWAYL